ncbi:hypothetical protein CC78DRAFT_454584, partial [Lojkania enalia]
CRAYVWTIMAICFIIVAGALAIPFIVGTRIAGVDPFQVTSFSWLTTSVVAISARSSYVTERQWHDFIYGGVVCN